MKRLVFLIGVLLFVSTSQAQDKLMIWDGDTVVGGSSWVIPPPDSSFKVQDKIAHEGKSALEIHGVGGGTVGGGWNWREHNPPDSGVDITKFKTLSFWVKIVTHGKEKIDRLSIVLVSSLPKDSSGTREVNTFEYIEKIDDGEWHQVSLPIKDFLDGNNPANFDPSKVWQINFLTWNGHAVDASIFVDEIQLEMREVRSPKDPVSVPTQRAPIAMTKDVAQISVDVDTKSEGTPISPYIYGAAMGDRNHAKEMGLTILRFGGNESTPINWKDGYFAKGNDWFFMNDGEKTPPEKNPLLTFHGDNKKVGLDTYLTMPILGRVAKDGTSYAFDIDKYPDQENWVGKIQPNGRNPKAGNGKRFVRNEKGELKKDQNGNPVTEMIDVDPNETSIEMSPDEQTDMLRFMIEKMNYGRADSGGIKYIALDNEPALWFETHHAWKPVACGYDELWQRTMDYSSRLKKIDPNVKVAGPASFGWTEYFYSGLDMQMINKGQGTWKAPPDNAAHGGVPLTKWWLQKIAAYEKEHGVRLVDFLDWHFYPQISNYNNPKANDPADMEARVQNTRAWWDPDYEEPSWQGNETNKRIMLLRLMKQWIDENCPGMGRAIGEYNFDSYEAKGAKDVASGVAQAEILGIFARERLDLGFFWLFPKLNSPCYFAFKMFRNPDGNHTAFGDRYLPVKNPAMSDVSVHAARDSKTGRLTFVLVNLRSTKSATVTINLSDALPEQSVTMFEYSSADLTSIGQLPAKQISGNKLTVDLPAMSVLRFDLKPEPAAQ